MYVPQQFNEDRVPVLHDAIRRIARGTLVTMGAAGLEASHVPMLVEPEPGPYGRLIGHIARANPQWKAPQAGIDALALFTGPEAYVTPSWYETKRQTGKVVPTWNYVAVQAAGPARFFDDAERLKDIVTRLTDAHESSRAAPWQVSDAPADYIQAMLKAIVGFELTITRLEGKWKMSQNRPEADRAGVIEGLRQEGGAAKAAVADLVAKGGE